MNDLRNSINSIDFAYWYGVYQTDGYLKTLVNKYSGKKKYYIGLGVGKKSIPMLNKFSKISQKLFKINGSSYKGVNNEGFRYFQFIFGCTDYYYNFFTKFNINKNYLDPLSSYLNSKKLFGAYLAGVIDGDGDINISRIKYPQCKIRICSAKEEPKLVYVIEKLLNCKVNQIKRDHTSRIGKRIFKSKSVKIEFRVIPKNFNFIEGFVLPNLSLHYKKNKILNYIKKRRVAGENRIRVLK